MQSAGGRKGGNPALLAFAIIATLTAFNVIFNVWAAASGLHCPYTTFLHDPVEIFSDFFKLAMSYPGGEAVRSTRFPGMAGLLANYPQLVVRGGDGVAITHFHMMPFSTLLSLATVRAMKIVDPMVLMLAIDAALLAWMAWIARSGARTTREALLWIGAAAISYPMLIMLDRGNIFAGVAALAIVAAMVLAAQQRGVLLSAVLFAMAVNIRPNAIIYAAPLLLLHRSDCRLRAFVALTVAGWGIFAVSLLLSSQLYPAYTLENFRTELQRYHDAYVVGDAGLAYGSSLYGGLKALFSYQPWVEPAGAVVAGLVLCGGIALHVLRRIAGSTFLFLVSAAYCLGSSVFGDYHLLVFLAPLLCRSIELRREAPREPIRVDPMPAILASCLVLAPKNYLFIHIVSYQVVFNPLLLLCTALLILYQGWRPPTQALPGTNRIATPSMQ